MAELLDALGVRRPARRAVTAGAIWGSFLGRLELRTLLEEMRVRYQAIELVGPARYARNNSAGFATPPVRLLSRRPRT